MLIPSAILNGYKEGYIFIFKLGRKNMSLHAYAIMHYEPLIHMMARLSLKNKTVHFTICWWSWFWFFCKFRKIFHGKIKKRLLTLNFAVAIGWWVNDFSKFITVLFIVLISWSFKMHIGLRNICFGNKYLKASPHIQCLVYNVPGGLPDVLIWAT